VKKIYLLLIVVIIGCKKNLINQEDSAIIINTEIQRSIDPTKALKFIRNFYVNNYGTDDLGDRDSTFTKFLSKRMIHHMDGLSDINNVIVDYDPFINAKVDHFDPVMISYTLKVNQVAAAKENEYEVSFKLFEEQTKPST